MYCSKCSGRLQQSKAEEVFPLRKGREVGGKGTREEEEGAEVNALPEREGCPEEVSVSTVFVFRRPASRTASLHAS